jgi:hypothetical protein
MPARYSSSSPWFNTPIIRNQLSILSIRPVSAEMDDYLYTIESQYALRPDLLAYDLYGDHGLWWVFTQRNLDVLQDPIFDFVAGIQIFIPKPHQLSQVLGT